MSIHSFQNVVSLEKSVNCMWEKYRHESKQTICIIGVLTLATKLCKCIKKVRKSNPDISEQQAIGICRKSVLHKKKLDVFKFKCKQKYKLEKGKQKSYKILKHIKKNKKKKNK